MEQSHYPGHTVNHQPDPTETFFAGLFDVGFSRFVSLRILKVAYLVSLASVTLACLWMFTVLVQTGFLGVMFALVATPVLWLFGAAMMRLILEAFAMLFRINDNLVLLASSQAPNDSEVH